MATLKILDGDGAPQYLNVIGDGTLASPYQSVVPDYRIPYAISTIFEDYGDTVSVFEKAKSLVKFGQNGNLASGVEQTVWSTGGIEVLPTSNSINRIVSSDGADTQEVIIEGHTLSGSDFTFVTQTATLNGTNPVTLTTPLARATRMYNNGSTDFTGTVTVYVLAGDTHLTAEVGNNQSLKCSTTISSTDYWIITAIDVAVKRTSTATVDFKVQVREFGKTFRTRYFTSSANGAEIFNFDQPIIVRPNSDVRVQATSNAASTSAGASIHGYLATIT